MVILAALALSTLGALQEDVTRQVRELVEKFRSDRIEERDEAMKRLITLGESVIEPIEKLGISTDAETRARIKDVVRRILPPLKIVATTPDLASLAVEIGGEQVSVSSVTKANEDPHFVEGKVSLVALYSEADAYVKNGLELETGYEPPLLSASKNDKIQPGRLGCIDASQVIHSLKIPGSGADGWDRGIHAVGNPHFLADPVNGVLVARLVRDRLIALRKLKKLYFEERYTLFRERVASALFGEELLRKYPDRFEEFADLWLASSPPEPNKLVAFLRARGEEKLLGGWFGSLMPLWGTKVIVDHFAWPYFANRFGIVIAGSLEEVPGAPTTKAHLDEVITLMTQKRVAVILTTALCDAQQVATVREATHARVLRLAHQVRCCDGAQSYLEMVDFNVKQIQAITPLAK